MVKVQRVRQSKSLADQKRNDKPLVYKSKSHVFINSQHNSELLMESVISEQTRLVMKEALKDETFACKYSDMARVSLSHLSNEHVERLLLNIFHGQKLITAALRTLPQPRISQGGFIRSINNTSRLVLDQLVDRKSPNVKAEMMYSTLTDTAIKQWNEISIWNIARLATQRLPRFQRDCSRAPPTASAVSLLYESKRRPDIIPVARLYHMAQVKDFVDEETSSSSDASRMSVPRGAVPADACITVLQLEGDAEHWRRDDDVIGGDICDVTSFHHEEIVDNGCEGRTTPSAEEPPIKRSRMTSPELSSPVSVRSLKRGRSDSACERDVKRVKSLQDHIYAAGRIHGSD